MFICQITGRCSKPGDKLNKVPVRFRDKTYKAMRKNEETREWQEVVIGKGQEITKELSLSQEGVATWESWSQEEKDAFLDNAGA